jgi:hypothetical protein
LTNACRVPRERVVIALNERIRIVQGAVAGASSTVTHGSIRAHLLAV